MKKYSAVGTGCVVTIALVVLLYGNQLDSAKPETIGQNPLEVQTRLVQTADGFQLSYSLTNTSGKDIVACSVIVDYADHAGVAAGRLFANEIMGLEIDAVDSPKSLGPGAVAGGNRRFPLPTGPDGRPVNFKISVDYVAFKDGSTWGPDSAKQSLKIAGIREGWSQARSTLRRLRNERGIQAVADALGN